MSVAEGVENLQVEYGIDTNNDGQPDNFLTTAGIAALPAVPGVNPWQNVVTVRIHLLTRSTQPTPGYIDTRTYRDSTMRDLYDIARVCDRLENVLDLALNNLQLPRTDVGAGGGLGRHAVPGTGAYRRGAAGRHPAH